MRYYSSTATPKTLNVAISSGASSVSLSNLTGLPTSYPYTLVIDPDLTTEEIVSVTGLVAGTTVSIARAQDGSSAVAHDNGASVRHMVTARDMQEPQNHIADSASHIPSVTGNNAKFLTNNGSVASWSLLSASDIPNIAESQVTNLVSDLAAKATVSDLALKAPLASPAFTGTPTAPTATGGTNTTQLATTAFVQSALGSFSGLPSQTGNAGKYLTTDGSIASWASVTTDPTADVFMMMGA